MWDAAHIQLTYSTSSQQSTLDFAPPVHSTAHCVYSVCLYFNTRYFNAASSVAEDSRIELSQWSERGEECWFAHCKNIPG